MNGCSTMKPKNLSNIHHLDEAANFLMLVSDDEKSLTVKCGLSPQDALNMLQPIHALIDEEIKISTDGATENQMFKCEIDCHCGIYSDITSNQKLKDDLLEKARATHRSQLIQCANKSAKWLCDSNLLKKLKTEIEPVSNAL